MITMLSTNSQIALFAIASLVAIALLLQAIVLIAIFFGTRAALKAARKEIEEFRAAAMPFVKEGRELFNRIAPRIESTSADLAAVVHTVRAQTDELQSAATVLVERASVQANRLDSMTTAILDAADRAGTFLSNAVHKPMRQLTGILASARAIIESLRTSETTPPRSTANNGSGDPQRFV
jgi:methyl-accepting chemotaxis protein